MCFHSARLNFLAGARLAKRTPQGGAPETGHRHEEAFASPRLGTISKCQGPSRGRSASRIGQRGLVPDVGLHPTFFRIPPDARTGARGRPPLLGPEGSCRRGLLAFEKSPPQGVLQFPGANGSRAAEGSMSTKRVQGKRSPYMAPRFAGLPRTWPASYPPHRPLLASEARGARSSGGKTRALGRNLDGTRGSRRRRGGLRPRAPWRAPGRGRLRARQQRRRRLRGRTPPDLLGPARAGRPPGKAPSSPAAALEAHLWAESGDVADASRDLDVLASALSGCALVIDALFGVGLDRPLRAPYVEAVRIVNAARAQRLSVDVPSGMNADTGEPLPVACAPT